MIVTTLVENSTLSKTYKKRHGLSIHLNVNNYNILFDLGPDGTFIENARKLDINIEDVDIVIISHGHKDHGGGLEEFLRINYKAKIYINKYAFESYYTSVFKYGKYYVGLNQELKNNERIILTNELWTINESLTLVSNVKGGNLVPTSNKNLFIKEGNEFLLDKFKHEQNLIINENGKKILISGCSHSGILNIIEESEKVIQCKVNCVIGGLHLFNPVSKKTEDIEFIKALGKRLHDKDIEVYTCHCTGTKAFKILKDTLNDNIKSLVTGQVITL